MRPNEKSSLCPITDVRLIESQLVETFLASQTEGETATYQKAAGAESRSLTLFYSRDFDGAPIRDFEFEEEPSCNGRRLVENPTVEQLTFSKGLDAYRSKTDENYCKEDSFVFKARSQFSETSPGIVFNEFEWLEQAGVWGLYQTKLPGK